MKRVVEVAVIIVVLFIPLMVYAEESVGSDTPTKEEDKPTLVVENVQILQSKLWLLKIDTLGDTLFTRTYGEDSEYRPYALDLADNCGFTVAGRVFPHNGRAKNFFLRFDSLGDTLWSYSADFSKVGHINKTPDGHYIVLWLQVLGLDYLPSGVFEIDSLGDTLWTGLYTGVNAYGSNVIKKTFDGGNVLIRTCSKGSLGNNVSNCLIKTDSIGDTLWMRTFGQSELKYIQQTIDGGFITTGLKGRKLCLVKIQSNGRIQWQRRYGEGSWFNKGFQVLETNEGYYIISGKLGGDFSLLCVNARGRILWQKEFGNVWFEFMERTSDDCFIITGSKKDDLWLLKVGKDGSVLWEKTYGYQDYDIGKSIKETGGGYFVLGIRDYTSWTPDHK